MSRPPKKPLPLTAQLNFLLGASNADLDGFELAKLAEVSDLRKELTAIVDRMVEQLSQAALAQWFKTQDRQSLKHAIENEESALEWAKRKIREGQRSGDELIPRASLPVGDAHRAAALRYQERQISKGLCAICPKPLDRSSVRYCTRHLEIARLRHKPKGAKGEPPGSIGWLYGDGIFESSHGKQPATLKALKEANEKRKRGK